MGPYDYAVIAGLALFTALGLRSGFVLATLLAIGLLGVVLAVFSVGTPQALSPVSWEPPVRLRNLNRQAAGAHRKTRVQPGQLTTLATAPMPRERLSP